MEIFSREEKQNSAAGILLADRQMDRYNEEHLSCNRTRRQRRTGIQRSHIHLQLVIIIRDYSTLRCFVQPLNHAHVLSVMACNQLIAAGGNFVIVQTSRNVRTFLLHVTKQIKYTCKTSEVELNWKYFKMINRMNIIITGIAMTFRNGCRIAETSTAFHR